MIRRAACAAAACLALAPAGQPAKPGPSADPPAGEAAAPSTGFASASEAPATGRRVPLVIRGVTVIDVGVTDPIRARLPGRDVLVRDGRIERIAPAGRVEVPAGARIVDGRGRFLLPGLWDAHVHLSFDAEVRERVGFPLLIAHGVTGVRDMASDCWEPCGEGATGLAEMRRARDRVEAGELLGPRLIALSSAVVRGPRVGAGYPEEHPDFWRPLTAEHGRRLARWLDARGVDVVKVYRSIPRAAFLAFLEEAGRLGLPVAGHLPWGVGLLEAARAGMRSIEHARHPAWSCTPRWEPFREAYDRWASLETEAYPEEAWERFFETSASRFREGECETLLASLAETGLHLVPTHITREMDARAADPAYRDDPRRSWIPPRLLRRWDADMADKADEPEATRAVYEDFFELGLRVSGMAHRAGVPVLVGTDAFDTRSFPGSGVHDELGHLVRAGLSPLEALGAATLRTAEFLGRAVDFGSVREGKVADLVLLSRDPLEDIQATRAIEAVVFGGVLHDRGDLDRLLAGVEEYVAGLPADP